MSDLDKGQTGQQKTARNPIKIIPITPLKKPDWIRVKAGNSQAFYIGECFGKGTATFMILGDLCTRRCPFCDVAHGRPKPPDAQEPAHLARTIADMALRYVVITSVDRDDLRDGGAQHFVDCIRAVRAASPHTRIEILTPDFRKRAQKALDILANGLPDVMNHNLETVQRLYRLARPGADYKHSLELLRDFKRRFPDVPTKSGIMVGLGETDDEILEVMRDMRAHDIDMLTIGQYLQPTTGHLRVERYVEPARFKDFERAAMEMGFKHAACGPLVRSSYHADEQAHAALGV
jgi:lipoic acid synthetase